MFPDSTPILPHSESIEEDGIETEEGSEEEIEQIGLRLFKFGDLEKYRVSLWDDSDIFLDDVDTLLANLSHNLLFCDQVKSHVLVT
jgi:hypothetical protein